MEIWNYTALELGAALREGACTVPEAVEALRQRERETAACGAYLAEDWERAMEEAEALQRRIFRKSSRPRRLPVSRFCSRISSVPGVSRPPVPRLC